MRSHAPQPPRPACDIRPYSCMSLTHSVEASTASTPPPLPSRDEMTDSNYSSHHEEPLLPHHFSAALPTSHAVDPSLGVHQPSLPPASPLHPHPPPLSSLSSSTVLTSSYLHLPLTSHSTAHSSPPPSQLLHLQEVARIQPHLTPFSLTRDLDFPSHYPISLYPTLSYYTSPTEFLALIATINAALVYPPSYHLIHLSTLALSLTSVAVNWSVQWGEELSWGPTLRWCLIAGSLLLYWVVARRLKAIVHEGTRRKVEVESEKLEGADPRERQGRLPFGIRLEKEGEVTSSRHTTAGERRVPSAPLDC